MSSKIKIFVLSILPGIFLIGFNIGTGSVTAMAKAGADYGMSLLWTIVVSCWITYFLVNIYGKFTIVSGQTALQAFKKNIHPAMGIFFIVALTANVCGSIMGVMGILANICYEWSKTVIDEGISSVYFALFFVALVYILFLIGKTKTFEKVMAVIVGIMVVCFLVNFFLMAPPVKDILSGLIPRMPADATGSGKTPLLVVASMVGTTVFSGLFIIRTTLVKESNWQLKDLNVQRRDATISAAMMFVISASIMAAAAGTLYLSGIHLNKASQMITLLEPLVGSLATAIFGFGIIAAGISSQFPNILLFPMLLSDYRGIKPNVKTPFIRLAILFISLLGLVVPIFHAPPVLIMIVSQAFGALLLPFTVLCIVIVGNKKSLMSEHKFNKLTNTALLLIMLFAVFMAKNSLQGILVRVFKG